MRIEDNQALRFILDDEIYLLDEDKNSYTAAPKPQPVTQTPAPVFNYLGTNKKNFLVLVNYPGDEFMPADHINSLEKVLAGKRMDKDDTAILNLAKHSEVAFESLTGYFSPKTLVVLGRNALPAGLQVPQFNLVEDRGSIKVLHTFSFDEMMTNQENKKAFWEQIKTL